MYWQTNSSYKVAAPLKTHGKNIYDYDEGLICANFDIVCILRNILNCELWWSTCPFNCLINLPFSPYEGQWLRYAKYRIDRHSFNFCFEG